MALSNAQGYTFKRVKTVATVDQAEFLKGADTTVCYRLNPGNIDVESYDFSIIKRNVKTITRATAEDVENFVVIDKKVKNGSFLELDIAPAQKIDHNTAAVMRVSPAQLDEILHPILDPASEKMAEVIAKGLPASPGGAVGTIVFTSEAAMEAAAAGKKVILIREETSPEDIEGMRASAGILTTQFILQDVAYYPLGHPVTGGSLHFAASDRPGIQTILESLMQNAEGED